MLIVNRKLVDIIGNKLYGVASDLGMSPGVWPDFIAVVDDTNSGFLFHREASELRNGEVVGFNYQERSSVVQLFVIND